VNRHTFYFLALPGALIASFLQSRSILIALLVLLAINVIGCQSGRTIDALGIE
jgi:hypothetical protein